VLTRPGLVGVVDAVKEGRVTFQRILTYALNSVTKKIVQVLFLAAGLVLTGQAILTPLLMVVIMITGDLLGMSLTTDNVRPSAQPNAWRVGKLTIAGVFVGLAELVFCTIILVAGRFRLNLGIETLRALAFILIVFGNQATTYTNRTRRRLWSTRPSRWLVLSSVVDISIAAILANRGIGMAPLPLVLIGQTLAGAAAFAFALDVVKIPVFKRLGITEGQDVRSSTTSIHPAQRTAQL
jgi:H+-transporting ATPase